MILAVRCAEPQKDCALFRPSLWPARLSRVISVDQNQGTGVFDVLLKWPTGVTRSILLQRTHDADGLKVSILKADWVSGEFVLKRSTEGDFEASIVFFFAQSVPHSFLLECADAFEWTLRLLGIDPLP